MNVISFLVQHGNPGSWYTDQPVAAFLLECDQDGALFHEALAELPNDVRARIAHIIGDTFSRTLSNQGIGDLVRHQIREYILKYLRKQYIDNEAEILGRRHEAELASKADSDNDAGDAQGSMP